MKPIPFSVTRQNWQNIFNTAKKHLNTIPSLGWFNSLLLVMLGTLSVYAKLKQKGQGVERLFSDPYNPWYPYLGFLTGVSEILWCLPIVVCAFTLGLIQKGKSRRYTKRFLLASTLLLSVLLVDDRFRLTLILVDVFGIPKLVTYCTYGIAMLVYAKAFWRRIQATPYTPLLVAAGLFIISSLVDLLPIPGLGMKAMLEDGTKLLGNLNLALYFWHICQQEVWRSLPAFKIDSTETQN